MLVPTITLCLAIGAEDLGQRNRFLLGVGSAQVKLREAKVVGVGDRVVDPVARRVHLEAVARLRGMKVRLPGWS